MIELQDLIETESVYQYLLKVDDNFDVVEDAVNNIQNYVDVDNAEIIDLNDLITAAITIGSTGNPLITVDSTNGAVIDTSVSQTGDTTFEGLVINDYVTELDESLNNLRIYPNGSTSGSKGNIFMLSNNSSGNVTFQLAPSDSGHEVKFVYAGGSNNITVRNSDGSGGSPTSNFNAGTTGGNPVNAIVLDAIGDTVTMVYIDSTNFTGWYIVSGYGYTTANV